MARTLNISNASETSELAKVLRKATQSANLNFLLGAGCSNPAIKILGNIEKEVQSKIDTGDDEGAQRILFTYLQSFMASVENLRKTPDKAHADVLDNYSSFLRTISRILFERKSNIMFRQASIFTTNYDLFIEKASESFLGSFCLNDGFHRTPSLDNKFYFSTSEFYNSLYNNGNLYNYQVEIPSINLIKLHGSLSWRSETDSILFSVDYFGALKARMDKIGEDGDLAIIRAINNKFCVVLPSKDKFKTTVLSKTYYDLLRIYANQLEKENTLLVAEGFSFDDEHILDITVRALRNPTLRLVIFSFKKEDVAKYETKFMKNSNVDIVFSDNEKIDFAMFNSFLQGILGDNSIEAPLMDQKGESE